MNRYSKTVALVVGLSVVALLGSGVSAKEESSGAAAGQAPVVAAPATTTKTGPQDEVRALLDGTSWALDLMPLSGGEKAKPQKDTVSFAKTKVVSEELSKAGYPESNYSLTIGDDGVAVWETMQTKEGEGVAFWRGELHGATMRGMLSRHPTEGPAKDFSFVGKKSEVAHTTATPASPATVIPAQPAEPPAQAVTQTPADSPDAAGSSEPPTPKKKKRGWF